jgi:glycosyltransferase involved in cell wall biosynthesis
VPALTHLVSLQQAAGVEAHFTEFVERARTTHPDWTQSWLNPSRALHPFFAERLRATLAHTARAKYLGPLKLPSKPAALRTWHSRRALARARTDVLMIWNRSGKVRYALDAAGAGRCIHWEHGAAWDAGHERDRRDYFARVRRAIANSRAAARVLQLAWNYTGDVRVCRNALRPSLVPAAPVRKAYPDAAIKLGVVARLYPVKGVAIVLHAVRALRLRGVDAELQIAGAGPELERLQALSRALGLADQVRFRGAVRDMEPFYRGIDCLVHAPLTEAFGLVVLEAAALGCPVIAVAIDGLPEAVASGVSGYCVAPTLPLAEYAALGGGAAGLPALVYDPSRDALIETPLVDPAALAEAVARLFASRLVFESMSASASEHVLKTSDFEGHVRDVMAVVDDARREA